MLHGHTIALAEDLIERHRTRDAFRMLDVLPLHPEDDPGVMMVRALLARIRVFEDDAPHLALRHLEPARERLDDLKGQPALEGQIRCTDGWIRLRLAPTSADLRDALFSFDAAARCAATAHDAMLRDWSRMGMASTWAKLREPLLAASCLPDPDGLGSGPWVERAFGWLDRDCTSPDPEARPPSTAEVSAESVWRKSSSMMRHVAALRQRLRPDTPVVLIGERGTGKSALARFAHELGPNASGPFLSFDARRQSVREVGDVLQRIRSASEATEDEPSRRPTLFVNAPSSVATDTQRRIAEDVAAGRCSLCWSERVEPTHLVREGMLSTEFLRAAFGQVVRIRPLRERREEIRPLVRAQLAAHAPKAAITPDALRLLLAYDWPGNVRQLRNEVDRAVALVHSEPFPVIGTAQIPASLRSEPTAVSTDSRAGSGLLLDPGVDLDEALARAERALLVHVLEQQEGNVSASSELLGLSRQGLYKKMHRLGIDPADFHPVPARDEPAREFA